MEERGKGVGRRTQRVTPNTKKTSRTPSRRRSPTPSKRERSPRRPETPEEKKDDAKGDLMTEEEE